MDAYPLYAASALAANAFVRCSFAGKSSIDVVVRRSLSFPLPAPLGPPGWVWIRSHKSPVRLLILMFAATAAFPLFGVQMYEKLGYQWATTLLAFLTLVMLPFPYIFFRYGKKIRGKSRFATD